MPLSTQVNTLFSYCSRGAPHSHVGGGTSTSTQWTIFGSTEYLKFSCDLNSLVTASPEDMLFYELYLVDTATAKLTPVPRPNGLITGSGGNLCSGGGLHSRRFFLTDTVSGLSEDSFVTTPYAPTVMRYASHIILGTKILV